MQFFNLDRIISIRYKDLFLYSLITLHHLLAIKPVLHNQRFRKVCDARRDTLCVDENASDLKSSRRRFKRFFHMLYLASEMWNRLNSTER